MTVTVTVVAVTGRDHETDIPEIGVEPGTIVDNLALMSEDGRIVDPDLLGLDVIAAATGIAAGPGLKRTGGMREVAPGLGWIVVMTGEIAAAPEYAEMIAEMSEGTVAKTTDVTIGMTIDETEGIKADLGRARPEGRAAAQDGQQNGEEQTGEFPQLDPLGDSAADLGLGHLDGTGVDTGIILERDVAVTDHLLGPANPIRKRKQLQLQLLLLLKLRRMSLPRRRKRQFQQRRMI